MRYINLIAFQGVCYLFYFTLFYHIDWFDILVVKSQGDDAILVPEGADFDEEVVMAIAQNDNLGPDDLEITENEQGQQVVKIKKSKKAAIEKAREIKKIQSESGRFSWTERQ